MDLSLSLFSLLFLLKDGDLGDDDHGEDGPREPDPEGRVEKYIGVKVKVRVPFTFNTYGTGPNFVSHKFWSNFC